MDPFFTLRGIQPYPVPETNISPHQWPILVQRDTGIRFGGRRCAAPQPLGKDDLPGESVSVSR
jgi:hypothetical protein